MFKGYKEFEPKHLIFVDLIVFISLALPFLLRMVLLYLLPLFSSFILILSSDNWSEKLISSAHTFIEQENPSWHRYMYTSVLQKFKT